MPEVSKADLDRLAKNIKEHIDERLLPMQEEIDEHELILRGRNKMNGLTGIGAWVAQFWKDMDA